MNILENKSDFKDFSNGEIYILPQLKLITS